jgi:hypothetical protein
MKDTIKVTEDIKVMYKRGVKTETRRKRYGTGKVVFRLKRDNLTEEFDAPTLGMFIESLRGATWKNESLRLGVLQHVEDALAAAS